MFSHKLHQVLVMAAALLAVGLVLFALQSTASNAQSKKESTLGFQVAQAPPATTPPGTPPATPATTPPLMVDGVDIGRQLTDSLVSLQFTLGSILDVASAQAALPKLVEITAQIEQVNALIGRLSAEQRVMLAGVINPLMPTLNQMFANVLAIPGVAAVLQPAVDTLRPKLATLSAAAPVRATTTGPTVVEIVLKEERENCIRRKGRGARDECCVARLRFVSGAPAQYVTNTGNVADLRDPNRVACITREGGVTYSESRESILPFDVATLFQPTAPGTEAPG